MSKYPTESHPFVLDTAGVAELLKSPEMESVVREIAGAKLSALGSGYDMQITSSSQRVKAVIMAKTTKARKDNLENNTLIKVVLG